MIFISYFSYSKIVISYLQEERDLCRNENDRLVEVRKDRFLFFQVIVSFLFGVTFVTLFKKKTSILRYEPMQLHITNIKTVSLR